MKRNIIYTFLLAVALVFTACGSDSKIDPIVSDANISLPTDPTDPTDTTLPAVDGSFSFYNIPSSITINSAGSDYLFKIQLIDKELKAVPGKTVTILAYDADYGIIKEQSVATDENGFANFVYTSPDSLSPIDGQTYSLTVVFDENGIRYDSEKITLSFDASSVTPDTYSFMNATSIVVTTPGENKVITVDLADKSGVGVSGKTISITTLPAEFGSLGSSTATTGPSGRATFAYTAPQVLAADGSRQLNLMFMDENQNTITATVNVTIQAVSGGSSIYNLINASTPIEVSFAREIKELSVQLVASDNTPQSGKTVIAKSIPSDFGTISNFSATTGADGYARFSYIAADTLTNGLLSLELYFDDTDTDERISTIVDINVTAQPLVLPLIVVPNEFQDNDLTMNNAIINLPIRVFEGGTNVPYSDGKVKVELPGNVIDGVDVGSFEAYEVDIVNGIATFKYAGPNNLQGLIDNGELNSTFMFYHEENPNDKKPVVMIYNPDSDQGYIPANYELVFASLDGKMTMGLQKEKTFNILLRDDLNNTIVGENVTSIVITSKNTFVGKLLDNGTEVNSFVKNGKNPININVRTNTKSGLLPIEVIVNFVDSNGNNKTMTQTINIVVYSGPATAMSISYAGMEQDAERAKYIEKFAVTVVDAYNNKVNTEPYIAVGAMVEYAVDGSSPTGERTPTSPRLWYGKFDSPYGSVVPGATFKTPSGGDIFRWVDFENDKLVVFGEGYVYEALGKWDIQPGANLDSLSLMDDYFGAQRNNLFYAVGHNNRLDLCSDDGSEYVGSARSDTYQINNQGTALIEFEYDYHLTGKDIMLWVNLSGYQADIDTVTRIGEARKHTLRGNGLITPNSYTLASGSPANPLYFGIKHENAPEYYRNGHFAYTVTGKCTVHNEIRSSNFEYDTDGSQIAIKDARSCDNGGAVYVELNVSNPAGGDCTISLDNILVSDEF